MLIFFLVSKLGGWNRNDRSYYKYDWTFLVCGYGVQFDDILSTFNLGNLIICIFVEPPTNDCEWFGFTFKILFVCD